MTTSPVMEWYIMNSSGVRSLSCSLGDQVSADKYILHDECAETIEELLENIASDNECECVTKLHLLAERLITKDLIPIIKHGSPDVNELQLVLRLFSELCQPIEEDKFTPPLQQNVRNGLLKLTNQVRRAFLDSDFVTQLFSHTQELIEEAGQYEMSQEAYDCIRYLLRLTRNVLYCSQTEEEINKQALLCLLLKNDLASLLIFSISCHNRDELVVTVSQVLSLLYATFQWKFQTKDAVCTTNGLAERYINNRLKRLIVQLLQGPLSTMAVSLKRRELRESSDTDCTYLSWCLTFFLPYITHVPVPMSKFRSILSHKFIGYLVYKVSSLVLTLFADDQTSALAVEAKERCMMLFSALDSLLTLVLNCKLSSVDSEEMKIVIQFHKDLVNMSDLWQILLFYICNFDVTKFPKSFLSQLVCINHKLLTSVEFYNQTFSGQLEQTVLEHIKQFANVKVIQQYTLLVETYSTNSEQTNLAVFTMLCHICVDCKKMDLLYSPTLLRLLGGIADNCEASEEDGQLASYVTRSFLDDLSNRPELCVESFINTAPESMEFAPTDAGEDKADQETAEVSPESISGWTNTEESDLIDVYSDMENPSVEKIRCRLAQLGITRSTEQVADKMMLLGLISSSTQQSSADITELVTGIVENGNGDLITWLQSALLTASYVKAMPKNTQTTGSPLCLYSFLNGHAYPVIPYAEWQMVLLGTELKTRPLLDKLQLAYVKCTGVLIPLIPDHINAETLYAAAEKLRAIKAEVSGPEKSVVSEPSQDLMDDDNTPERYQAKPGFLSSTCNMDSRKSSQSNHDGNLWLSYMQSHSKT